MSISLLLLSALACAPVGDADSGGDSLEPQSASTTLLDGPWEATGEPVAGVWEPGALLDWQETSLTVEVPGRAENEWLVDLTFDLQGAGIYTLDGTKRSWVSCEPDGASLLCRDFLGARFELSPL